MLNQNLDGLRNLDLERTRLRVELPMSCEVGLGHLVSRRKPNGLRLAAKSGTMFKQRKETQNCNTNAVGLFLRTSPLSDGSKLIHQISPRLNESIRHECFRPFECLCFAVLILSHPSIGRLKVIAYHMRVGESFNELADFAGPDDAVQAVHLRASACKSI